LSSIIDSARMRMPRMDSRPVRRIRLSLDWVALLVALGLAALVRAGILGSVPW
jgi:hypothetical protein